MSLPDAAAIKKKEKIKETPPPQLSSSSAQSSNPTDQPSRTQQMPPPTNPSSAVLLNSKAPSVKAKEGVEPASFPCKYCAEPFESMSQRQKHQDWLCKEKLSQETHSPSPSSPSDPGASSNDPHFCSHCNREFNNADALQAHITHAHAVVKAQDTKDYVCEICGKAFSSKKGRVQHMVRIHGFAIDMEEIRSFGSTSHSRSRSRSIAMELEAAVSAPVVVVWPKVKECSVKLLRLTDEEIRCATTLKKRDKEPVIPESRSPASAIPAPPIVSAHEQVQGSSCVTVLDSPLFQHQSPQPREPFVREIAKCMCSYCFKAFSSKAECMLHQVEAGHPSAKVIEYNVLECKFCFTQYQNADSLQKHLIGKCSQLPAVQQKFARWDVKVCIICMHQSSTVTEMEQHYRSAHRAKTAARFTVELNDTIKKYSLVDEEKQAPVLRMIEEQQGQDAGPVMPGEFDDLVDFVSENMQMPETKSIDQKEILNELLSAVTWQDAESPSHAQTEDATSVAEEQIQKVDKTNNEVVSKSKDKPLQPPKEIRFKNVAMVTQSAFKCSKCGCLLSETEEADHLKSCSSTKEVVHESFKCPLCSRFFIEKIKCRDHQLETCLPNAGFDTLAFRDPQLPCPYEDCEKRVWNTGLLSSHLISKHRIDKSAATAIIDQYKQASILDKLLSKVENVEDECMDVLSLVKGHRLKWMAGLHGNTLVLAMQCMRCNICGMWMVSEGKHSEACAAAALQVFLVFICPLCTTVFGESSECKDHVMLHQKGDIKSDSPTGESPEADKKKFHGVIYKNILMLSTWKLHCKTCKACLKNKIEKKRHGESQCGQSYPSYRVYFYKCPYCQDEFRTQPECRTHQLEKCLKEGGYDTQTISQPHLKCPVIDCEKMLFDGCHLRKHLHGRHTSSKEKIDALIMEMMNRGILGKNMESQVWGDSSDECNSLISSDSLAQKNDDKSEKPDASPPFLSPIGECPSPGLAEKEESKNHEPRTPPPPLLSPSPVLAKEDQLESQIQRRNRMGPLPEESQISNLVAGASSSNSSMSDSIKLSDKFDAIVELVCKQTDNDVPAQTNEQSASLGTSQVVPDKSSRIPETIENVPVSITSSLASSEDNNSNSNSQIVPDDNISSHGGVTSSHCSDSGQSPELLTDDDKKAEDTKTVSKNSEDAQSNEDCCNEDSIEIGNNFVALQEDESTNQEMTAEEHTSVSEDPIDITNDIGEEKAASRDGEETNKNDEKDDVEVEIKQTEKVDVVEEKKAEPEGRECLMMLLEVEEIESANQSLNVSIDVSDNEDPEAIGDSASDCIVIESPGPIDSISDKNDALDREIDKVEEELDSSMDDDIPPPDILAVTPTPESSRPSSADYIEVTDDEGCTDACAQKEGDQCTNSQSKEKGEAVCADHNVSGREPAVDLDIVSVSSATTIESTEQRDLVEEVMAEEVTASDKPQDCFGEEMWSDLQSVTTANVEINKQDIERSGVGVDARLNRSDNQMKVGTQQGHTVDKEPPMADPASVSSDTTHVEIRCQVQENIAEKESGTGFAQKMAKKENRSDEQIEAETLKDHAKKEQLMVDPSMAGSAPREALNIDKQEQEDDDMEVITLTDIFNGAVQSQIQASNETCVVDLERAEPSKSQSKTQDNIQNFVGKGDSVEDLSVSPITEAENTASSGPCVEADVDASKDEEFPSETEEKRSALSAAVVVNNVTIVPVPDRGSVDNNDQILCNDDKQIPSSCVDIVREERNEIQNVAEDRNLSTSLVTDVKENGDALIVASLPDTSLFEKDCLIQPAISTPVEANDDMNKVESCRKDIVEEVINLTAPSVNEVVRSSVQRCVMKSSPAHAEEVYKKKSACVEADDDDDEVANKKLYFEEHLQDQRDMKVATTKKVGCSEPSKNDLRVSMEDVKGCEKLYPIETKVEEKIVTAVGELEEYSKSFSPDIPSSLLPEEADCEGELSVAPANSEAEPHVISEESCDGETSMSPDDIKNSDEILPLNCQTSSAVSQNETDFVEDGEENLSSLSPAMLENANFGEKNLSPVQVREEIFAADYPVIEAAVTENPAKEVVESQKDDLGSGQTGDLVDLSGTGDIESQINEFIRVDAPDVLQVNEVVLQEKERQTTEKVPDEELLDKHSIQSEVVDSMSRKTLNYSIRESDSDGALVVEGEREALIVEPTDEQGSLLRESECRENEVYEKNQPSHCNEEQTALPCVDAKSEEARVASTGDADDGQSIEEEDEEQDKGASGSEDKLVEAEKRRTDEETELGVEKNRYQQFGKRYECDHCSACFSSEFALFRHLSLVHSTIIPPENNTEYKCPLCKTEYPSKWALQCHMKWVHSVQNYRRSDTSQDEQPQAEVTAYKCVCGQSITSYESYHAHCEQEHKVNKVDVLKPFSDGMTEPESPPNPKPEPDLPLSPEVKFSHSRKNFATKTYSRKKVCKSEESAWPPVGDIDVFSSPVKRKNNVIKERKNVERFQTTPSLSNLPPVPQPRYMVANKVEQHQTVIEEYHTVKREQRPAPVPKPQISSHPPQPSAVHLKREELHRTYDARVQNSYKRPTQQKNSLFMGKEEQQSAFISPYHQSSQQKNFVSNRKEEERRASTSQSTSSSQPSSTHQKHSVPKRKVEDLPVKREHRPSPVPPDSCVMKLDLRSAVTTFQCVPMSDSSSVADALKNLQQRQSLSPRAVEKPSVSHAQRSIDNTLVRRVCEVKPMRGDDRRGSAVKTGKAAGDAMKSKDNPVHSPPRDTFADLAKADVQSKENTSKTLTKETANDHSVDCENRTKGICTSQYVSESDKRAETLRSDKAPSELAKTEVKTVETKPKELDEKCKRSADDVEVRQGRDHSKEAAERSEAKHIDEAKNSQQKPNQSVMRGEERKEQNHCKKVSEAAKCSDAKTAEKHNSRERLSEDRNNESKLTINDKMDAKISDQTATRSRKEITESDLKKDSLKTESTTGTTHDQSKYSRQRRSENSRGRRRRSVELDEEKRGKSCGKEVVEADKIPETKKKYKDSRERRRDSADEKSKESKSKEDCSKDINHSKEGLFDLKSFSLSHLSFADKTSKGAAHSDLKNNSEKTESKAVAAHKPKDLRERRNHSETSRNSKMDRKRSLDDQSDSRRAPVKRYSSDNITKDYPMRSKHRKEEPNRSHYEIREREKRRDYARSKESSERNSRRSKDTSNEITAKDVNVSERNNRSVSNERKRAAWREDRSKTKQDGMQTRKRTQSEEVTRSSSVEPTKRSKHPPSSPQRRRHVPPVSSNQRKLRKTITVSDSPRRLRSSKPRHR